MNEEIFHLGLPPNGPECAAVQLSGNSVFMEVGVVFEDDDAERVLPIHFRRVTAFRIIDLEYAKDVAKKSYEALCEIVDSQWVRELKEKDKGLPLTFGKRHFAMYLKNCGYIEVIAENFEIKSIQDLT